MPIIGYHFVKSTYGMWLPGGHRGSWSSRWDEQIGYTEPHMLHLGDPIRLRMAEERMKHRPVALDHLMMSAIERCLGCCAAASTWRIAAGTMEPTHIHLLLTTGSAGIDGTRKWLAQQMTKSIHQETDHKAPVWTEGKWCSDIYDESNWQNALNYIERHNVRKGLGSRPYAHVPGWY